MQYVVQIVFMLCLTLVLLVLLGSTNPAAKKNKKIVEVKTINQRLGYANVFDQEINEALADGWALSSIQMNNTNGVLNLIAFMERHEKV